MGRGRSLPPGVGELDARHGAMIGDEPGDPPPGFDVLVLPDPGVGRRDAALGE